MEVTNYFNSLDASTKFFLYDSVVNYLCPWGVDLDNPELKINLPAQVAKIIADQSNEKEVSKYYDVGVYWVSVFFDKVKYSALAKRTSVLPEIFSNFEMLKNVKDKNNGTYWLDIPMQLPFQKVQSVFKKLVSIVPGNITGLSDNPAERRTCLYIQNFGYCPNGPTCKFEHNNKIRDRYPFPSKRQKTVHQPHQEETVLAKSKIERGPKSVVLIPQENKKNVIDKRKRVLEETEEEGSESESEKEKEEHQKRFSYEDDEDLDYLTD